MAGEGIVVSQEMLFVFGFVLATFVLLVAIGIGILVAIVVLRRSQKTKSEKGDVFQARADLLNEDELAGVAGAFPEGGTHAYQASGGEEGPPSDLDLKNAREYREAMRIVDRHVERAIGATLREKRGQAGAATMPTKTQLLDPDFWGGPHQAAAPGVKDE